MLRQFFLSVRPSATLVIRVKKPTGYHVDWKWMVPQSKPKAFL